ncbi:MAG: ECF-type sigma factor [Planctomycetaceae bacterium]
MSHESPISIWINELKAGDPQAAQAIFEQYFQRIIRLAQRKLQGTPRRMADEEDVALSAFHSFCRGAARGRFPKLDDRDDLWTILAMIASRKSVDQIQYQKRQKRGSGRVHGESIFVSAGDDRPQGLADFASATPPLDGLHGLADECEHLLEKLDDDSLRALALLKLEGFTNEEIAKKLDCARRTVQRRLKLIQDIWAQELNVPLEPEDTSGET